jgi:hypothetical protein
MMQLRVLQVLHLWGQTIGRHHKYTHRAGAVVISVNLISSIIAIGFLCKPEPLFFVSLPP